MNRPKKASQKKLKGFFNKYGSYLLSNFAKKITGLRVIKNSNSFELILFKLYRTKNILCHFFSKRFTICTRLRIVNLSIHP